MPRGPSRKRRGISEVLLVCEAAAYLIAARLALLILPFRAVSPYLGRHLEVSPDVSSPWNRACAYRVQRGIHFTFIKLPWPSTCLVQAIAGMMMLKRRGEASTLYIGIGREQEAFEAHAWLRSGEIIVTGGAEMENFKVLSSFMQPGRHDETAVTLVREDGDKSQNG